MSVDVVTFGCRLNAVESDMMRRHAENAGLDDIVVVNTCAVTSEAVAQARQAIRRLHRENPARRIVVSGCAAQSSPQNFSAMPEVARVLGNDDKLHASSWQRTARDWSARIDAQKTFVSDIMQVRAMAPHLVDAYGLNQPRVFVQVQNGCDHRCTFCIIPFGRGPSRSAPMTNVIAQIRALVERGYAEIVLTGVDLTSYGTDLDGAPSLGKLVKQILREVPALQRLRLSSIDSAEADDDLLDVIASDARLMPHLHLSLQSGDDMILKRMKRRHNRADAIALCARLRALRPDIALGADLIAGFPTETAEMFAQSLELIEECGLTFLHVFPYSPRPMTPAARMPQLDRNLVRERARRLREAGDNALKRRLDSEIGKTRSVLTEGPEQGRTEHFIPVATVVANTRQNSVGAIQRLTVTGHDGRRLLV